jgi:type IV secretion system protein VirD4
MRNLLNGGIGNDYIDLYRPKMPGTFGSAEWVTMKDLRDNKMLAPVHGKNMGPIIGMLTPLEIGGREEQYVYASGEGHLLTSATTGSGKGRGQIITNLLWWPGSAMVLDLKGENYERTAGWRQSMGQRIIRFAPFENGSEKWNPIDAINDGCSDAPNDPRRQENARFIANLMITPNPHAKDPYWDNAAKTLLQGLMMFVATAPLNVPIYTSSAKTAFATVKARTMAEVRRLLTQDLQKTLGAMSMSDEEWVRETAGTMNQMEAAREQSASLKTVLMEHTAVWSYRRIQNVTSETTFRFSELRAKGRYTTIYIVIPFEALSEYRNLLRVMTGWCMRELHTTWSKEADDERPPVLVFLDEFPQLGYMQPIEEALLYIRSYGVKFWFFIQDISMLQQHYEKTWRQFIANCAVRCFFGVGDLDTAKLVSEMSGASTVRNRSYQAGVNESEGVNEATTTGRGGNSGWGPGGGSGGNNWNENRTIGSNRSSGSSFNATLAYIGRPLFMPDEVLRMPFQQVVCLVRGMPAIRGWLRFWDKDTNKGGFAERGDMPINKK